jgi:hypothetical protein
MLFVIIASYSRSYVHLGCKVILDTSTVCMTTVQIRAYYPKAPYVLVVGPFGTGK